MGEKIAAHRDKPCIGGVAAHGLQAGVEEHKGCVDAAGMAALLQGLKTLLLIGRRSNGKNGLPLARRRCGQLWSFGRIPERFEVNIAKQERRNGGFSWRLGWLATLRKGRASEQKQANQRYMPAGNGSEDAGCEIL